MVRHTVRVDGEVEPEATEPRRRFDGAWVILGGLAALLIVMLIYWVVLSLMAGRLAETWTPGD